MSGIKHFIKRFIKYFAVPVDSAVATPINNGELFFDLSNHAPYPGPVASDPYPNINDSPHVATIKGAVFSAVILAFVGNLIIQSYKRLRKKEAVSTYFFFERFRAIEQYLKTTREIDDDKCCPEILLATAFYYNPDLSSFVLRWRRMLATLTGSKRYLRLKEYFNQQNALGETEKDILERMYQQINQKLADYINKNKDQYGEWSVKKHAGKWILWQKKPTLWKKNKIKSEKIEQGRAKTIARRVWGFIEVRLDELEKASYIFWIAVFIFYFFAGVGVLGTIVWPPVAIAGVFLLGIWGIKFSVKLIETLKKVKSSAKSSVVSDENSLSLEDVKHHMQLMQLRKFQDQNDQNSLLLIDKANDNQILSKNKSGKVDLYEEIYNVLDKRWKLRIVGAILNGFVSGFFKISFISWLLFSAIGLTVSISPLGLSIVAGGTLLLGIAYGIYSACKHFKSNNTQLENRHKLLLQLKKQSREIPDISLRKCDRLFRRGDLNKTSWALTKQVFKRVWVGLVGIGTGILLLKLSAYGVTNAVLFAVLGITTASIAFLPIMSVFLTGGLLYAAWRVYDYHIESQERQLDLVMNSLSRPLFMSQEVTQVVEDTKNTSSIPNAEGKSLEKQALNNLTVQLSWKKAISPKSNTREGRRASFSAFFEPAEPEDSRSIGLVRSQSCSGDLNTVRCIKK